MTSRCHNCTARFKQLAALVSHWRTEHEVKDELQ